jgi:hypothetical protein
VLLQEADVTAAANGGICSNAAGSELQFGRLAQWWKERWVL